MSEPGAYPGFNIELEYALHSSPRYGWGKPSHPLLYDLLDRNRDRYREFLHKISQFEPVF
jgi:hypothetical protein